VLVVLDATTTHADTMDDAERYVSTREALKVALEQGHANPRVLRGLLIGTTSTTSYDPVMDYFRRHLTDRQLLRDLIAIALEGEDNGDAPWAAANVITEFPGTLLREIEPELIQLSKEQWLYLNKPAKEALQKIKNNRA